MASKFTKAKAEQAYFKAGLYGKTGSGKTFTSLLIAEGLAKREGKRIAFLDTERGSDFYLMSIPERRVHPDAFDFDRIVTRSLMETIEAIESIDPAEYGCLVIDSITHLWDAARAAYSGKLTSTGGVPIQAWQQIKKPYKRLMTLFLDGQWHAILCGREGIVMEEDESGDIKVIGTKMKAEGETPHEPHILGRMAPQRDTEGGYVISIFFEKDRSGVLQGRTFTWPNFETVAPVVAYLKGDHQGQVGSLDDAAEKDAAAIERQQEQADAERRDLFTTIRSALLGATSAEQPKSAWSLTQGKKGKLGEDLHSQLATIKDTRKSELMAAA